MSLEINSYRASDLFRAGSMYGPLIYINQNSTVEECLNLLASKNILSVPVYDQSKNNWIGILDVYQIMTYIAFAGSKDDDTITLESVLDKVKLNVPVIEILGITGKKENDVIKSLWVLPVHAPLLKAMEYLGKGIYRILVTDTEIPLCRLITQSDMIRFIHEHWDQFGDFKNTQINNSSFIKPVHTIQANKPAIYGFQLMRKKEINAIAVINESGSIISTLSDSDLRTFTQNQFENLFLPTTEFLLRAHTGEMRKPVVCSDRDNLKRVVDLMVREKIHRVWIVDGEMKPIGVVSMTDVCLYFYTNLLNP
jgi:CBS domain containing-hemolysin-like protein